MCNPYIHAGGDVDILAAEILAVFDLERVSTVKPVREWLRTERAKGRIYYCSLDMPRSIILCADTTYVSNVSAATIKKRMATATATRR
jgi:hypothetical protein